MIADVSDRGNASGELLKRLREGDSRALARAISIVESGGPDSAELIAGCKHHKMRSLRVGVTGSPGAGKSTLADQMVRWFRRQGKRVAVLAVDPSSPFTGGALLGDRIRMQAFAGDDSVYIRSMASRGHRGGVAAAADEACAVMEAAGKEVLLIETVGVGQEEIDVVRIADVTVLVLVPGMGDDVQSLKAGVMEAADIFVVNKSDREGADRVAAEVLAMQGLAGAGEGWIAPVVKTNAVTGDGVQELMEEVERCAGAKKRGVEAGRLRSLEGVAMDHLGIAVRSIEQAKGLYELLGLEVSGEEEVKHEKVRVAMIPLEGSRIELLEPMEEDSTIGRFLTRKGQGLHHVAIKVTDVDARFSAMKEKGIKLASDAVRVGAGGHRYFFVHPESTGGVLLEIVGG